MNSKKRVFSLLLLPILLGLSGCDREKDAMLDELLTLEEESYSDEAISSKTIDELRIGINRLQGEIERTVEAGEQLINYYRLAGLEFMGRELYGLAVPFFRKALDLQPTNRLLSYRIGVCTVQIAMSQNDAQARRLKFEEAEEYYLYAIRLDPRYAGALYALSVLYVFEMDRPEDAEAYLERILEDESRHFKAMFLLARVYVGYGRIDDAVALYDEIIRESNDQTQVEEAKKNRGELVGGAYGS